MTLTSCWLTRLAANMGWGLPSHDAPSSGCLMQPYRRLYSPWVGRGLLGAFLLLGLEGHDAQDRD